MHYAALRGDAQYLSLIMEQASRSIDIQKVIEKTDKLKGFGQGSQTQLVEALLRVFDCQAEVH